MISRLLLDLPFFTVAVLILIGLAAMLFTPFKRLSRLTHGWPLSRRLRAAAWVPVVRLTGDLAKMVGYPVGVWWRLKRRSKL